MPENKPLIALCCVCDRLIINNEIVRYRTDGVWRRWCWPCFKTNHLKNLTRLQEKTDEPR